MTMDGLAMALLFGLIAFAAVVMMIRRTLAFIKEGLRGPEVSSQAPAAEKFQTDKFEPKRIEVNKPVESKPAAPSAQAVVLEQPVIESDGAVAETAPVAEAVVEPAPAAEAAPKAEATPVVDAAPEVNSGNTETQTTVAKQGPKDEDKTNINGIEAVLSKYLEDKDGA